MFLRRTKAMEQPYYTLEIEPDGTTRQKRTVEITRIMIITGREVFEKVAGGDQTKAFTGGF